MGEIQPHLDARIRVFKRFDPAAEVVYFPVSYVSLNQAQRSHSNSHDHGPSFSENVIPQHQNHVCIAVQNVVSLLLFKLSMPQGTQINSNALQVDVL
jgi:hypothetical protein